MRRRWLGLVGGAARLDAEVRQLHRQRSSLVAASLWMLASWIAGTGEVWLALRFLGWPVDMTEALILESLGQAVRSAAFAIPGSLGVQEGGYMAFAELFGLTTETGLALSLIKRVRELLLGVPALAAWQLVEGHRLWRNRKGSHREGKS